MSQDRRGFPDSGSRPGGNGNGAPGSVRRARERMEAGLPPERPPPEEVPTSRYSPSKGNQASDSAPSKRKPPVFPSRDQQGGIGAAISRPSPMPQWPLRDDGDESKNRASPDNNFAPKGPPPQRPPRPSRVPSILDSSKIQDYTPSFPARQPPKTQDNPPQPQQPNPTSWEQEDNLLSPDSTDPPLSATTTTRSSGTTSSVGTIPDFPLPATQIPAPPPSNPGPPRKQNLGPPPAAARRGPSSYYSRGSFVSPIPEEFPEQLKKGESLASSKAIPSSWGSGSADSGILGAYDEVGGPNGPNRDGSPSLVREASLGKRGKPSLRTINKSQSDQSGNKEAQNTSSNKPNPGNAKLVAVGNARPDNTNNDQRDPRRESFSSSSSSESDFDLEKPPIAMVKGKVVGVGSDDINLHRLEKGSGPRAMSDRRPGTKRPPKLDIDAVREAETRGSLTSLSDLIRRATKLATNLDRDKTASRLGMLDVLNGSRDFKKLDPNDRRTSGSISDILASFPPPGLSSPTGEQRGSQWPGPFDSTNPRPRGFHTPMSPGDGKESLKPRRRCCGMRPWVFALVCIIVVLLVAAAVIVPIVLIVLPRQREAAAAASSGSPSKSGCEMSKPCLNGGVSISRGGSCSCVCVNGFGGDTCATTGDASCTTLNVDGVDTKYNNATVGDALPRLLEDSQTNFSIPLDSTAILDLFSSNGISCTSENALVSFNGASQKRRSTVFLDPIRPEPDVKEAMETAAPILNRHHQIMGRQADNNNNNNNNIATTNGIIYQPTATANGAAPTKTSSPSESSNPSSDSRNSNPDSIITPRIQDFARISILFILQQTRMLSAATAAQGQIQSFFAEVNSSSNNNNNNNNNNQDAQGGDENRQGEGLLEQTMGVGGNGIPSSFVLDFVNFRILLEDGTLVGVGA